MSDELQPLMRSRPSTFAERFEVAMEQARRDRTAVVRPTAIGKAVGRSHATIIGWQSGTKPELDPLPALARYLRVDLIWLAFGEDEPGAQPPPIWSSIPVGPTGEVASSPPPSEAEAFARVQKAPGVGKSRRAKEKPPKRQARG